MSNRNKNQGRQQEKPKADPPPAQQGAAATAPPTDPPPETNPDAPPVDAAAAAAVEPPVEPAPEPPKPRHEYPATLQHCGYPVDALNAETKVWCHGCHREYLPEKLEAWKPAAAVV